jgi:hypothetical protein
MAMDLDRDDPFGTNPPNQEGPDRSRTGYTPLTTSKREKEELKFPDERTEWKFDGDAASAPEWIDKGAVGTVQGQRVLYVPQLGPYGNGPHTPMTVYPGDTVVFKPEGPIGGSYEVIKGERVAERSVDFFPPAMSGASVEAFLQSGAMTVDDLSPWAKRQLARNYPQLAKRAELDADALATPVAANEYADLYGIQDDSQASGTEQVAAKSGGKRKKA